MIYVNALTLFIGWEEDKGLGKDGKGITENVGITFKDDTKGLGEHKRTSDTWTQHSLGFENLLSSLNDVYGSNNDVETALAAAPTALIKSSRPGNAKLLRAKLDAARTEDDLAAIIYGKTKDEEEEKRKKAEEEKKRREEEERKEKELAATFSTFQIVSTIDMREYFKRKMRERAERLEEKAKTDPAYKHAAQEAMKAIKAEEEEAKRGINMEFNGKKITFDDDGNQVEKEEKKEEKEKKEKKEKEGKEKKKKEEKKEEKEKKEKDEKKEKKKEKEGKKKKKEKEGEKKEKKEEKKEKKKKGGKEKKKKEEKKEKAEKRKRDSNEDNEENDKQEKKKKKVSKDSSEKKHKEKKE